MQRSTGLAQCLCEVTHGREEERRALLARGHVGGFLRHLGHPHRILRGIEAVEAGGIEVKLIPQHDHEVA